MDDKEERMVRKLWEESEVATERDSLTKLARAMVSRNQFNKLKFMRQRTECSLSEVISEILKMWKSSAGKKATLLNLEKIFRAEDINDVGGTEFDEH